MSNNWKGDYSELKNYLAKNPQIEIGMNIIRIPDNVRPDFYRLFDRVRTAFIKEKYQVLLDEAFLLRSNYNKAAEEIKKSLNISEIKLSSNLNWFMNDPINGLARSIFTLLFDLLKGKVDTNTFEHEAMEAIKISFSQLFKIGYERWVAISLLNLLSPDKAWVIPIDRLKESCQEPEPDEKTGLFEEQLPDIKEMESLYLKRDLQENVFILSSAIVHSTKLNRYVSIGADLVDATWSASEVSNKREWQQIREIGRHYKDIYHWPDIVVYVDEQPEDIALVADFGRFCRPDVIVECMEQAEWYNKEGLDQVKSNYHFLNPRLGSYVVSRLPVPEEAFQNLITEPAAIKSKTGQQETPKGESTENSSNIHIFNVGYDPFKLVPIIEILSAYVQNVQH